MDRDWIASSAWRRQLIQRKETENMVQKIKDSLPDETVIQAILLTVCTLGFGAAVLCVMNAVLAF